MKKVNLLFIWCLLVGTLVSCTGEIESDPTPAISAVQEYVPTTTGTTWSYGGRSPYTLTVTGNTKVINGKTYHEIQGQQGVTAYKAYVVTEKNVYTTIGLVSGMSNLEVDILKDDLTLGSTWQQTGEVNGIDVKLKFTIIEKDITKIVDGKTFNDVIAVKMAGTYTYSGIETGINFTTDYYFAKGVGLILIDLGANGNIPLKVYEVK